MHFSIPDTQEVNDENGKPFVLYNIHMNGVFHCSVRYKQLHNLHEQLKKNYDNLPIFPSKKFLPLNPAQLEERRLHLEKYIQLVSQDNHIMSENLLRGFLLNAQMETQNLDSKEVNLDVYLMNGYKITVNVFSTSHTDSVLKEISVQEKIPSELEFHFALFAVRKEGAGGMAIVRKLQEFESPYMTLQSLPEGHRLVLRKGFWDSTYDNELLESSVTLNILYIQTLNDLKREWVIAPQNLQRQLTSLQAKGSKKEFMNLARTLKYYGYLHFQPCISDYPEPGTEVAIAAGNKELNFQFKFKGGVKEGNFKVTRMKIWRITSIQEPSEQDTSTKEKSIPELSFEYLISRDKLQWITITSSQAILMSICLQGMVEELLMRKDNQTGKYKRPRSSGVHKNNWSYMKRDGSSHQISSAGGISSSTSSEILSYSNQDEGNQKGIMKTLEEGTQKAFMKSSGGKSSGDSSKDFIENSAFEGIGDDDL